MHSGCVIVSEPLPERWDYRDIPAVQIRSWSALVPTLRDLLADPGRMEQLHQRTRQWWTDYASEHAVAKYVAERIASILPPVGTVHPTQRR